VPVLRVGLSGLSDQSPACGQMCLSIGVTLHWGQTFTYDIDTKLSDLEVRSHPSQEASSIPSNVISKRLTPSEGRDPKRGRLKGREMRVPDEARIYCRAKTECAIGTCDNWTIGPRFRLVRTFDLAPSLGRVALGGRFPGLKPWAKSCSPCGAQNKGLSSRIGLAVFSSPSAVRAGARVVN
jgi:hypothetical protein